MKILPIIQSFHNQLGSQSGHRVMQRLPGGFCRNRNRAFKQHIAGIQLFNHFHNRNAAFIVSGFNRTLNRRRTAPPRQQRAVNIDAAQRKSLNHGLRQNQPVSSHHRNVCLQSLQFSLSFGTAQRFQRPYQNSVRLGKFMHR